MFNHVIWHNAYMKKYQMTWFLSQIGSKCSFKIFLIIEKYDFTKTKNIKKTPKQNLGSKFRSVCKLKKPHHDSYSFHIANHIVVLYTQFSGKRGKLPRYLHTSFSMPLESVIYHCPWNLSYKHANTNDKAGLPNPSEYFIRLILISLPSY